MKQSRLDELMLKSEKNELTISDLGEICGSLLLSVSRHSSEIKNRLSDMEKKLQNLENKIQDVYRFQPAFGVISDMDEDDWGFKSFKLNFILNGWSVSKLAYVVESIW